MDLKKLYQDYAKNLNALIDNGHLNIQLIHSETFICPTCFQAFAPKEVADDFEGESLLTKEHVPPKAYGGSPITFTCKTCNNNAGSQLDVELGIGFNYDNWGNPDVETEHDTKISIGGNEFNGKLEVTDVDRIRIEFHEHRSDPDQLKAAIELMTESKSVDFEMKFRGAKHKNRLRAYLRIAHLFLFSKFGYTYLFRNSTRRVIQIINGKRPEFNLDLIKIPELITNDREDGIYVIDEPKEIHSILCVYTLQHDEHSERVGCILPTPYDKDLSVYDAIDSLFKTKAKTQFRFRKIDEIDYLTDSSLLGYYDDCFIK